MIITNPENLLEKHVLPETELQDYYLYFLWYKNTLVYIGQTMYIDGRIKQHTKDKLFDKVTYQVFPQIKRETILEIELSNIIYHKPLFNNKRNLFLKDDDFCFLRFEDKGKIIIEKNKITQDGNMCHYYDGKTLQSILAVKEGGSYKVTELVDMNSTKIFFAKSGNLKLEIVGGKLVILKDKLITDRKKYLKHGKYKNEMLDKVKVKDPNYFKWLEKNVPDYEDRMIVLKEDSAIYHTNYSKNICN